MNKQPLTVSRQTLLTLVLILKVLPLRWFYGIRNSHGVKYSKLTNKVHDAVSDGMITIEETYPEEKFIYLTKKGYSRITQKINASYIYRDWSKGPKRTETIFRLHHYQTFRFILEYLNCNEIPESILTDYDKNCSIGVKIGSHTYFAYPDCLIRPASTSSSDNYYNLIALESDTGIEEVKRLFDKLLRYLIIASKSFDRENIEQIKIYFSFNSEARMKSVFDKSFLYPLFEQGSRIRFLKDKMDASLSILELFSVLSSGKIELYSGLYTTPFEQYTKEDTVNKILSFCPELAELYKQI